jgi:lipopolysaccharide export system permease protein
MLFDSTLRRELARNFGGTLVVILTIVLTILFISTLGQAAVGRVDPQDVALLLAYIALGNLPTMLALSLFVAVVATLSRMYRASEMTIWFASGVSLQRFVRAGAADELAGAARDRRLALFVWPWQNERSAELKDVFERRSDLSRVAPGQFQSSGDGQRTFFFEGAASDTTSGRNVLIVASRGSVEAVTTARSGRIDAPATGRFIVLDQGQRNEQDASNGEKTLSRFESFRSLAGERWSIRARSCRRRRGRRCSCCASRAPSTTASSAWRLGLVLAAANMLLLGIGMSASNPRHASNWNLLFALLGFFAYYNFINLTQAWVGAGRLGLGAALLRHPRQRARARHRPDLVARARRRAAG